MVIRFRLRTVLIVLSLTVLLLPLAGLQVLRLYESALVRQTESELIAQAAFVAASYRNAFRAQTTDVLPHSHPVDEAFKDQRPRPRFGVLDLAESPIYGPFPDAVAAMAADHVARTVGDTLTPVLLETQKVMLASIRVVDHRGVVVATTGEDIGMSLAGGDEIRRALLGEPVGHLRRRTTVADPPSLTSISRGTAIRVFVASPIVEQNRIIGAVMLSRTPANIVQALYAKRYLLLQAGGVIFAVVVLIAIFASRTVVGPIQRLAREVEAVAQGRKNQLESKRQYRTLEVAQLARHVTDMAEALQKQSSYLRDFARHVSHEFKTPIAAISGAVEVLRDHLDTMTEAERQRFLGNIEEDLDRLERLTQGLLELAHADMAATTSETASLDNVADGFDRVTFAGDTGSPATISPASLRAALTHLVENANEHGAKRIAVTATARDNALEISVCDDGAGIPEANRARIFEPFFTTHRDHGGTGLGLAVTQALLRNAGGDIEHVASAAGTTFRLTIPLAAGDS